MSSTTDPPLEHHQSTAPDSSSPPPLPTDSKQFIFSCKCLNVKVDGRVPGSFDPSKDSQGETRVWIGKKSEHIRFKELVTYEAIDSRPSRRDSQLNSSGVLPPCPSKRKCWVCDVELYKVDLRPGLTSVEEEWIVVDLNNGIRWGDEYEADLDAGRLPFSSLLLELPTGSSQFGRPPNLAGPTPYPPPSQSPISQFQNHLLPPVQDPFFLPPPFIPSHPHLHALCNSAVGFLKDAHEDFETEVKHFIALKSRELGDLEEKVRCEVELLWGKYCEGPGKNDQLERSRSASLTRSKSKSQDMPLSPPNENPIIRESITSPPYAAGTSLLSASISANGFQVTPPVVASEKVDNSLMAIASKHDKTSDARAVAMSHVFSALDEAMDKRRRNSGPKELVVPQDDTDNKDSWIDGEKTLAQMLISDKQGEDASEDRTPRARQTKELHERRKSKDTKVVKFEEPPTTQNSKNESTEQPADLDHEDYVFDFEFDDSSFPPIPSGSVPIPPLGSKRNWLEASLSEAYAADAPSHRGAWRRLGESSSLYASLRRDSRKSDSDQVSDDNSFSQLATSMPIAIAHARQQVVDPNLLPKERKTSLSDREGILVPPLMPAMRERGVYNSLGLDVSRPSGSRRGQRSASVSRERERNLASSQMADPGVVFEAIADEQDDDDDEFDGIDGEEGTLRERGTFVPPHIPRRTSAREGIEAGWRSMINE
ncbi:hypothetical protein BCR39DRAFT_585073 [Naematelia encephala]|uniref:Uncharacterized protein n=1 Tax=Naematelia encephala TaxID=71784 RepID=A0A1Y2BKZ0_9TREE|nr:hypothetical protein BCR39DRAFT_585073 [Naematelia encephala]